MNFYINGKQEDMSMLMVNAVRYALGKKTYIVDWTCEFIKNNIGLLTNKDLCVMLQDIKLQKENGALGNEWDVLCWKKLLDVLERYAECGGDL